MTEIYADFNDVAADGSLPLSCAGSVASIARLGRDLSDGERVVITDGELRAEGTVSRTAAGWQVEPGWRMIDGTGP